MSTLYEVKIKIEPEQQEQIIAQLDLRPYKKYSDTDFFLRAGDLKEKLKVFNGKSKHYQVEYDGQVFVLTGRELSDQEANQMLSSGVAKVIKRHKEVFKWSDQNIEVAFDRLDDVSDLFIEVYDRQRDRVVAAKEELAKLGYTYFIAETYAELYSPK
ncbi:hypothetical protein ACFL04_04910 [Patescibacteria group bacterium]